MKKILSVAFAAAALVAGFSSCSDSAKLAREIQGSWQGNAAPVAVDGPGILTMADTWTFTADPGSATPTGGPLLITSMASVECPLTLAAADSIAPASAPYAVTVAAKVNLQATWDLDSHDPDDELVISIDPRTLSVEIDPDAVTVSSDGNPATLDSIPPALYAEARSRITEAVQQRFFPITRLDDVEVRGDALKFEIPPVTEGGHDTKVSLRKQGPAAAE